ncbi:MAG: hypothetical protein PHS93_08760 [Candidatus Omnitrophica bacterium]|nr:hypothetical protein [Candidatus Omnitrophota bacterium]
MGIMKEFAQDLAESMGLENINQDVLEIGQKVLDAKRDPIKLMKIAKLIRNERLFNQGRLMKRVCCICHKTIGYKEGSGMTHGNHSECFNEFYKAEIEAGLLTAV